MKKFYVKPKTETVSLEMEQSFMGASVLIQKKIIVEDYKEFEFSDGKENWDVSFD